MQSIKDNSLLYYDDETANVKFAFAANDKLFLYAHKHVLELATNYFGIIFNTHEHRDTCVAMVIDSKYEFEAFELVLRLVYGCVIDKTEWNSFSIEQIFNAAVIIHDFRFKGVDYQLHKNYEIKSIFNSDSFKLIYGLLELSSKLPLNSMSNIYLKYIDKNAHKVMETLNEYIETCFIAPEVLITILDRDSFAVAEIEIFKLINKWFVKNSRSKKGKKRIKTYKQSLIETLRLELLTIPELTSTVKPANIIAESVIDAVIQKLKKGKVKKRYRNYAEAANTVRTFNHQKVSVAKQTFPGRPMKRKSGSAQNNMATKVAIRLLRPELINQITFHTFCRNDTHIDAIMHYYVEVKSRGHWDKVCDNSHTDCFSSEKQIIDFQTKLVSEIAIIGINATGNFEIKKLKYKLVSDVNESKFDSNFEFNGEFENE